ncbi:hypothetical protein VIDI103191_02160 [Vibrio diazotrophicus]
MYCIPRFIVFVLIHPKGKGYDIPDSNLESLVLTKSLIQDYELIILNDNA